jgi:hypothetical protein
LDCFQQTAVERLVSVSWLYTNKEGIGFAVNLLGAIMVGCMGVNVGEEND